MKPENKHLPLVSVIVTTYNRQGPLVKALESILAQTYRNFEIIVVNDCGQDVSEVVEKLNTRKNITYLRHDANRGPAAARNTALKVARGKYISYLDDDDLYYPNHLETLVNFLETSDYKVAYTDVYRVSHTKKDGKYKPTSRDVWSFEIDYDKILVGNVITILCVMHEKACLDIVGLFDENLWIGEDWELWIRMSRQFKFAHIKKITAEFSWKLDETNISSSKRTESARVFAYIYNKHRSYAENNPRIRKMQEQALKIQVQTANRKDWARREKLKILLAKFIGIKNIDRLYRLKMKLFR